MAERSKPRHLGCMGQRHFLAILTLAIGIATPACTKKVAVQSPPPATITTPSQTQAQTQAGANTQAAATAVKPNIVESTPRGITDRERAQLNQSLGRLEDALFDYDQSTIRPDAMKALQDDVAVVRDILAKYPQQAVRIEGHADERGSAEYNLALADRRAEAAKEYLVNSGVTASQISIISYGKEKPFCTDHNEECWQKNRRAHLVAANESGQIPK